VSAGRARCGGTTHRSSRAAFALIAAALSSAPVSPQDTVISDEEALRRFASELTGSEVGYPSIDVQREPTSSRAPGLAYRFVQDLDGDGRAELVLLGHGVDRIDLPRTFVLILSQTRDGTWQRSKLFMFDKEQVVGESRPMGINVFFCEHCDSGGRVTWNGSDYRFDPF
jgi:hypothetical protein